MLIHGFTDKDIHPPRFGGTERAFGLYRGLARHHEVRVLCMVEMRNRAPRESVAAGVQILRRRAWYTAAAWRLERLGIAPLALAAVGHTRRGLHLAAELPSAPDVRAFDFSLAGLMRVPGAALRVYLSHNVESDFFAANGPRLLARGFWARRLLAFERSVARRADLVVAVSEEDAGRFEKLYGVPRERVAVIPNGYDETAIRPPAEDQRRAARGALGFAEEDYVCVFVGSDWGPNRDAAEFAVDRLMPAVHAGGVRLIVAGGVARAFARRREPWLVVKPDVADLLPLLHAADCGINPVSRGGGSNVKVPTYLGAGLAVASTPFGMRGYVPLRPWVTVAENDRLEAALRARPRGWGRDGAAAPPPVAAHAWGALGESLGQHLSAAIARRDGERERERERERRRTVA